MMKNYPKSAVALIGLMVFTAASWTYAQTVTQGATAQSTPTKTIFDFKADLKLTDRQEKEIREALADLTRELQLNRAKLTILTIELDDLLKKEANLDQIKKNLQDQANIQAAMRYTDIAASQKINKVLTTDQLARWRDMQASQKEVQKQAR